MRSWANGPSSLASHRLSSVRGSVEYNSRVSMAPTLLWRRFGACWVQTGEAGYIFFWYPGIQVQEETWIATSSLFPKPGPVSTPVPGLQSFLVHGARDRIFLAC